MISISTRLLVVDNDNTTPRYPAYVVAIIAERDALRAELDERKAREWELIRYLNSPKFFQDTTVQVTDVMNRLGAR